MDKLQSYKGHGGLHDSPMTTWGGWRKKLAGAVSYSPGPSPESGVCRLRAMAFTRVDSSLSPRKNGPSDSCTHNITLKTVSMLWDSIRSLSVLYYTVILT